MSKELKKAPYVIRGIPQIRSNTTKHTPLFSNYVVAGNFVFISGQTAIDPETGHCVANTCLLYTSRRSPGGEQCP